MALEIVNSAVKRISTAVIQEQLKFQIKIWGVALKFLFKKSMGAEFAEESFCKGGGDEEVKTTIIS